MSRNTVQLSDVAESWWMRGTAASIERSSFRGEFLTNERKVSTSKILFLDEI